MTGNAILRETQADFNRYFNAWSANMDSRGMGVLMVVSGDDALPGEKIRFAYLTLAELRAYMEGFSDRHDVMYRWVRHAGIAGGIPLVIIPEQP